MTRSADETRWKRWSAHLERIIQETYRTHHYRQLYRGLGEITHAANLPASAIFDAFGIWYVTTQTSSVRRQLDRRKDTVSLWRLLDDIARNPDVASRERHVAVWGAATPQPIIDEAHANFDASPVAVNATASMPPSSAPTSTSSRRSGM